MKKCLVCFVLVVSVHFSFGEVPDHIITRQKMIPSCNEISDEIIEIWTILDMVRSVTIEPQQRVFFIHQIFKDMIAVLCNITSLWTRCLYCGEYYNQNKNDILYLSEIIDHVSQTFEIVMMPLVCGEEELFALIMIKIADISKQLNSLYVD